MYLSRLLKILEVVATSGTPLSVKEITTLTGFPQPSCYKLIHDLLNDKLLIKANENKYILGERLKQMVRMDHQDSNITLLAKPLLEKSAQKFGVTFFLSRLRQKGVEIIYAETPKNSQASFLHPGLGFRPLHACSCAKVIAAFSDESYQLNVIRSRLKAYTRNTRTNPTLLKSEFKNIKAKGYAECVQEIEVGICSVAAPVFVQDLGVFLSLGATGPLRLFSSEFRVNLGIYLIGLSKELGDQLVSRDVWTNGTIAIAS